MLIFIHILRLQISQSWKEKVRVAFDVRVLSSCQLKESEKGRL